MQELPNSAEVHLGKAIAALNDETFETLFYHWLSRSIEVDNTTMLAYFQQHRPRILFAHASERRVHAIAFVGYPADGVSVHICLGRDAVSGRRFSARDIATARRLAPIACGLIRQRWSDLRSSGDYSEQALADRLIESLLTTHGIKLSPRQAEIALLILRGHSSVSIGLRLEISSQTVKVFRKQLYRKCSISSQAELFSLIMPILSESVLHKPR